MSFSCFLLMYSHLQLHLCSFSVSSVKHLFLWVFSAVLQEMHREMLPMFVMLMVTLYHVSGVLYCNSKLSLGSVDWGEPEWVSHQLVVDYDRVCLIDWFLVRFGRLREMFHLNVQSESILQQVLIENIPCALYALCSTYYSTRPSLVPSLSRATIDNGCVNQLCAGWGPRAVWVRMNRIPRNSIRATIRQEYIADYRRSRNFCR